MFPRSLALAAAVVCGIAPLPAHAADAPPKPLRTIVYDIAYSATTLRREQTSGFTNTPNGSTGSVAGQGIVDRRFTADDRGTLTASVVAATPDGGLVVDSAYAGRAAGHPPVRVAIYKYGGLSFNPHTRLSPEELRLLPYLARGFVAERTIAPGESWTVPAAPPGTGTTTYRVAHVEGERATLSIDGSLSMRGPEGFDEHQEGTTVYATDALNPVSLDLKAHTRRQISTEQNDTTDAHLVATLVSDTFAKR